MRVSALVHKFLLVSVALCAQSAFAESKFPTIKIDAGVFDAKLGTQVGKFSQSGNLKGLFKVQKQMVKQVLTKVGVNVESLPPQVIESINKIPTTSFQAFTSFSTGLDALDKGDYKAASQAFEQATKLDPGFGLAKQMQKITPTVNTSLGALSKGALTKAKGNAQADQQQAEDKGQGKVVEAPADAAGGDAASADGAEGGDGPGDAEGGDTSGDAEGGDGSGDAEGGEKSGDAEGGEKSGDPE